MVGMSGYDSNYNEVVFNSDDADEDKWKG